MKERSSRILIQLTEAKDTTLAELAQDYEVSERTIRNDVSEINSELRDAGYGCIAFARGGRIICPADMAKSSVELLKGNFYSYKLSKRERVGVTVEMLLTAHAYITLAQISDHLFVSRSTVIGDLDNIKDVIRRGRLKLISYSSKGLRVEGDEGNRRLLLIQMLYQAENTSLQQSMMSSVGCLAEDILILQKILREKEKQYKCYLTDNSFREIVLYLGVSIFRMKQGCHLASGLSGNTDKMNMARSLYDLVAQYHAVTAPLPEVAFLSVLLGKAHYLKRQESDEEAIKIQLLTRQFIAAISAQLAVNIAGDYDFFENLSNHLISTLQTELMFDTVDSPIHKLVESHQEIYEVVCRYKSILEAYAGRCLAVCEIDYIMVHICAAVERAKNKSVPFNVIVACNAGIGTSRLLLEKLEKHFNFRIVDIMATHNTKDISPGECDFIVTTVPLADCDVDSVVVSPLLTDEDCLRIAAKMETLRNTMGGRIRKPVPEISASGIIEQLEPVLRQEFPEASDEALRHVRKTIRLYFSSVQAERPLGYMLHYLLPASHIRMDVECRTWQEAVRESAQCLLNLGYIKPQYVQAIIENIERNGPYIVISRGFALPHESPQHGSIKMGMSLIRLKQPIAFGNAELDPVEFVCCLSPVDQQSHLEAMFSLINMLQDESFKQLLREARTSAEAARIIEQYDRK
jgi:mannitol operon transcriptional antiterminator